MAIKRFIKTGNNINLFNINNVEQIPGFTNESQIYKNKIIGGEIYSGGVTRIADSWGILVDIKNEEYITFSADITRVVSGNITFKLSDKIESSLSGISYILPRVPLITSDRYIYTIHNTNKLKYLYILLSDKAKYDLVIKNIQVEIGDKATDYREYQGSTSFKKYIKINDVSQIIDFSRFPNSKNISGNIDYNKTENNQLYLYGSTTDSGGRNSWGNTVMMIKNHKYLTHLYKNLTHIFSRTSSVSIYSIISSEIFEFNLDDGEYNWGFNIKTGVNYDLYITPELFDLTEMYGAGNEPKTVEEFKERFPNDYYPYQHSWRTIYKRNIIKDGGAK